MKNVLEYKKFQFGRVFYVTDYVNIIGKLEAFYAIFLGFSLRLKNFEDMKITGNKEKDIYTWMSQNPYKCVPVAIPIGIGKDISSARLRSMADFTLTQPVTKQDLINICNYNNKSFVDDMVHFIDVIIPEEKLNIVVTKSQLMTSESWPELYSLEQIFAIAEKYYDKHNIKDIGNYLTNVKKTTQYKPMHFYILKTEKTLRMYYCLCETETDAHCFVLVYNGKPTDKDSKEKMVTALLNSNLSSFLASLDHLQFRMMSDVALLEIQGIESVTQNLSYNVIVDLRRKHCCI